jgi:hypothetical protein
MLAFHACLLVAYFRTPNIRFYQNLSNTSQVNKWRSIKIPFNFTKAVALVAKVYLPENVYFIFLKNFVNNFHFFKYYSVVLKFDEGVCRNVRRYLCKIPVIVVGVIPEVECFDRFSKNPFSYS